MSNTHPKSLGLLVALVMCGCGPLHSPMPTRFDDANQLAIDKAWNDVFESVNQRDGQALLDALMTSYGYEMGVDRLSFRSEKQCQSGVVIMEVQFDRLRPMEDRFVVTFQDRGGHLIRRENYDRKQVETTYNELFIERSQLEDHQQNGGLANAESERLNLLNQRMEMCESMLPNFGNVAPKAP